MQTERLISMANQIGDFFRYFPDEAQAQQGIATHLQRYWTPAMCAQLVQHMQQAEGDTGLHPIVYAAVKAHITDH